MMANASAPTARFKLLNWKGIALLAAVLAVCDLAVAYGLSPLLTDHAVMAVNRYTRAKVIIRDLRLHPVILTLTARTIEAADPEEPTRRMFLADSFKASLDPLELLTGRVSLGELKFKQVELVLVKDAQGDFNVEKLLKKEKAQDGAGDGWTDGVKDWFKRRTGQKDDWFGDAYDRAKQWVRKPDADAVKESKKREVREEPRGRVVSFYSPQDPAFKIGTLRVDGGRIILTDRSGSLPPLEDVRFSLDRFVMRRSGNFDFEGIAAAGKLKTSREGSFDLELTRTAGRVRSKVLTRGLDLAPLRPLYEASSPVVFEAGYLTLDCRSELTAENVDSRNKLKLEDYRMTSTSGAKLGPVPAAMVVEALNRRKELELDFNITGNPDKPSMSGFETTLWSIVKDDLGSQALQTLESKTGAKLSELSEKLKKLF
jgi:hypothetical protein